MTPDFAVVRRVFALASTSFAIGATAGAITTLSRHARQEIDRRGYPSWEECHCDFKTEESIFQVLYSRNEQRGETIFSEAWGITLAHPPQWLRRLLHHSSQVCATINPGGTYVMRVSLNPQQAGKLASLLFAATGNEESLPENSPQSQQNPHIIWRREVLYAPHRLFDKCIRRLYPAHIPQERIATTEPFAALWDPQSNLPLPDEGELLETPEGTRIDCIGWFPSQISYCTARME